MRRPARQQTAATLALAAPIGGWNARDALALMAPTDAIQLDNWFPRPDRLQVRNGSSQWATGLGGTVDTLAEFASPTSRKLLAAANGSIFNASSAGAIGAALASGFSSNQWQTAMMTTAGGSFLLWFNGTDTPQKYDGTNVTANTITGTSLTATNLVQATVYRSRVFIVEKNSLNVWYLAVNAIAGAANVLNLGQFCKLGGSIQAVGTWTVDAGEQGSDDILVAITSQGEVLLFKGVDPSSATTWAMVGIFRIAKPIGRRCLLRFGADLIMILQDGVYEASRVLQQSVESPALSLSDKIRGAFADAGALYGSTAANPSGIFGWDAMYYPNGQRLIVNIPQDTSGTTYVQYVMNSISRAWCRFTGWNARSWALFDSVPYYGDASGVVWKTDTGTTDNSVLVPAAAKQAFTDLGMPGRVKHLTLVRPKVSSNGAPQVGIGVDVDFADGLYPTPYQLPGTNGSLWNVSPWNVTPWGIGERVLGPWVTLGGLGTVIALKINSLTRSTLAWFQTDFVAEPGGIL
jgi:hypothetical protein